MVKGLENLANMEYPGRVIIIGKNPLGVDVVGYAITGRSPSSQARKFVEKEDGIYTEPTDEETLKKGNPALLIYPAIKTFGDCVVVSNGAQTKLIFEKLRSYGLSGDPEKILKGAFEETSEDERMIGGIDVTTHEPDEPNFTPRISGVLTREGAYLSIIKRAEDGSAEKKYFPVPLSKGEGKLIATYTGVNQNPLPSFTGEPLDVAINTTTIEEFVKEIYYKALAPKEGKDFRVGVAGMYQPMGIRGNPKIINRCDLGGE